MPRRGHDAPGPRPLRVGEELRHALAHIFEQGRLRDPALAGLALTVTEVRVSPDLKNATAYVMPLAGAHAGEAMDGLEARQRLPAPRTGAGGQAALRARPSASRSTPPSTMRAASTRCCTAPRSRATWRRAPRERERNEPRKTKGVAGPWLDRARQAAGHDLGARRGGGAAHARRAKAGHAGTLDPLATGVLPIALGEATKTVSVALGGPKSYRFTLALGRGASNRRCRGRSHRHQRPPPRPPPISKRRCRVSPARLMQTAARLSRRSRLPASAPMIWRAAARKSRSTPRPVAIDRLASIGPA